jgi:hypothetical protein
MGKKISNKEVRRRMKMNELVEAEHWLVEHKQKITTALIVIAVVAAGYYFYSDYRQKKMINSLNQYNQALRTAGQQNTDEALLFAEEVIKDYPSTPAYPLALLLKADLLYEQGKNEQALEVYEQAARSRKAELAPAGLIGAAICQENLGNFDESEKKFKQVLSGFPNSGFENRARVYLAMMYERNDRTEDAVRLYEAVPEDSAWHEQVQLRLEWLNTPVVTLKDQAVSEPVTEETSG